LCCVCRLAKDLEIKAKLEEEAKAKAEAAAEAMALKEVQNTTHKTTCNASSSGTLAEIGKAVPAARRRVSRLRPLPPIETFHSLPAGSSSLVRDGRDGLVRDGLDEEQESDPLLDMHAVQNTNPTTLRALSHYEIFHGLVAGIATVDEVARSCAGVHGWAAWVPRQLKLAFAMGTHARLGAGAAEGQGCPYLMMPADLLERVVEVWVAESSGGSTAALKKKRVEVIRAALYASREERISREERMTRD
jgi:hypothetical protein